MKLFIVLICLFGGTAFADPFISSFIDKLKEHPSFLAPSKQTISYQIEIKKKYEFHNNFFYRIKTPSKMIVDLSLPSTDLVAILNYLAQSERGNKIARRIMFKYNEGELQFAHLKPKLNEHHIPLAEGYYCSQKNILYFPFKHLPLWIGTMILAHEGQHIEDDSFLDQVLESEVDSDHGTLFFEVRAFTTENKVMSELLEIPKLGNSVANLASEASSDARKIWLHTITTEEDIIKAYELREDANPDLVQDLLKAP